MAKKNNGRGFMKYKLIIKIPNDEIEIELNDISELEEKLKPYYDIYYEINLTMIEENVKKLGKKL